MTTAPAAQAAEAYTTTTTIELNRTSGTVGDYLSITGETSASGGFTEGVAYLQRQAPGRDWQNVATDDDPSFSYFPDQDELVSNAAYRIVFVGGTDSSGNTYGNSESAPVKLRVFRKMDVTDTPGRLARLKIVVKPNFGGKKVVIQTRKAGKFRTTGRVRTNKRGVAFKTFAGSRRGIRYRVIAPGGRDYQNTGYAFTIERTPF